MNESTKSHGVIIRTIAITLLCIALGIVAAMQYRTILDQEDVNLSEEKQIADLRETIIKLNSELDSVTLEKDELKDRLNRIEQSSQDELLQSLQTELDNVKLFAGITDVKGSGVYVQITVGERVNAYTLQNYLLLLVNELRACGAQAISINGKRIVSMSEIRVVNGDYISVNAEQLSTPYEIYAIGDPAKMLSGITLGGDSAIVNRINNLTDTTCIWHREENIQINGCDESMINTDRLENRP